MQDKRNNFAWFAYNIIVFSFTYVPQAQPLLKMKNKNYLSSNKKKSEILTFELFRLIIVKIYVQYIYSKTSASVEAAKVWL